MRIIIVVVNKMSVEDYLMITGIYMCIILIIVSSVVDLVYRLYMNI